MDLPSLLSQLESKMMDDLEGGRPYEALQYVQSFVARKKKAMGQSKTSSVVFHGAKQLVDNKGSSSAGTLLKWFIEAGAGVDHSFKLHTGKVSGNSYCDVKRVVDLISPLSSSEAFPIVDLIYAPLHLLVAKANLSKTGHLAARLNKFETICAKVFQDSGKYLLSFKSFIRLGEVEKSANVLKQWADEGYPSERPLFFGRMLLFLLSETKTTVASDLLKLLKPLVTDNIENQDMGGVESAPLAVWHLAVILTELIVLPPMPRVDKNKLFGLLYNRYSQFLAVVDKQLLGLLNKIGENTYHYQPPTPVGGAPKQPNPMAMLQGLMGGGIGGSGPGGPDMENMLKMMSRMQQS